MSLNKESFLKNKILIGFLVFFGITILAIGGVLVYIFAVKPTVEIDFVKTEEIQLPERINSNTEDFSIKSEGEAILKINDQDKGVFTEYKTKPEDFEEGENLVEVQRVFETPLGVFKLGKFSKTLEVDRVEPAVEIISQPTFLLDKEKDSDLVFKSEEGVDVFLNDEAIETVFEEEQYIIPLKFEKGLNKFKLKVADSFDNVTEKDFEVEVFNAEGYEILDCYGAKIPFDANKYQVGYSGLSPNISFNVAEAEQHVENSQNKSCDFDNGGLEILPLGTVLPCIDCGFSPEKIIYLGSPNSRTFGEGLPKVGDFQTKQGNMVSVMEDGVGPFYNIEFVFDYNGKTIAVGGYMMKRSIPTQAEKDSLKTQVQEMASNLYLD